jgi:hypothetical protein
MGDEARPSLAVTDEMLAERQARASELALASARRRLLEADDRIAQLTRRVGELELALAEQASGSGLVALRAELARERHARVAAEQRAQAESARVRERVVEGAEADLEAELEVVLRRAAEFEQTTIVALRGLHQELRDSMARQARALARVEDLRRRAGARALAPGPGESRAQPPAGDAHGPAGAAIEPWRFDDALARLREREQGPEAHPSDGEPDQRGLIGRLRRR